LLQVSTLKFYQIFSSEAKLELPGQAVPKLELGNEEKRQRVSAVAGGKLELGNEGKLRARFLA